MADLNKVLLIGRLTRDPELRYTPAGKPVCDLAIAINKTYIKEDKTKVEETVFVDVTVWGKQAESTAEHMKKGKTIFIEGELKLDSWESKAGEKRSKMRVTARSIQFLSLTAKESKVNDMEFESETQNAENQLTEKSEPKTKEIPEDLKLQKQPERQASLV